MPYSDYKCFRFAFDSGVAFVSIDHPPINLLDETLSQEFDQLSRALESDESIRVVVLQSALPEFFNGSALSLTETCWWAKAYHKNEVTTLVSTVFSVSHTVKHK